MHAKHGRPARHYRLIERLLDNRRRRGLDGQRRHYGNNRGAAADDHQTKLRSIISSGN